MDSHLQHVQVDHSLCKYDLGKLSRNVPNAYKRCIESASTNVKGVQEPSCDSGGSGRMGNSLGSDPYCGNENIGSQEWQVASGKGWVGPEWEWRQFNVP